MVILSDNVFMYWYFCVVVQAQEMSSPSKSKGKMKYQYDKELAHSDPSSIISILDNVMDTKIGHVDVANFLQRVEALASHEMKRIKRSNIHLMSMFPM